MKRKNTLLTLAAVMLLASCGKESEQDNAPNNTGAVAATFTTQITRAAGNSWSANDQIGIFMIKSGDNLAPPYIVNSADNIAYKTAATGTSGAFSVVNSEQTIYFPATGNVDFISYYPFKAALEKYVYPVNVSDQSNQEAIDLLYSNNAKSKNSSTSSVAFNFKHKLSKLAIKLSAGDGYTAADLNAVTVKIKGLNTIADFMLSTGTLSGHTDVADISAKTITAGAAYEAIVLPAASLAGAKIELTIAQTTLSWDIATAAFVEGNRYNYNLVVGRNGITVGGSTIDDWEDNPDPGVKMKNIAYTDIGNMMIQYVTNVSTGKVNEIRIKEIDNLGLVTGGFSETINVIYAASSITIQGTIPNPSVIDIFGKGLNPVTYKAVYTLNAAGLASSSTIESSSLDGEGNRTTIYGYNADNQLISVVETDNETGEKVSEFTATWIGRNLTSCVLRSAVDVNSGGESPIAPGTKAGSTSWEEYTENYTYYSNLNHSGALLPCVMPSIYYAQDAIGVLASAIGIFGKGPKNYLAKIVDSDDYQIDIDYTFDAEGYPISATQRDADGTLNYGKVKFTFK